MKSLGKTAKREIFHSLGRYLAILTIICLGVGFFCGIKSTKKAIIRESDAYFKDRNFYHLELLSSFGFSDDDIEKIKGISGVKDIEGSYSSDVIIKDQEDGNGHVFKILSIPKNINRPVLSKGRMPKSDGECLADSKYFSEKSIGDIVTLETSPSVLGSENSKKLNYKSFKIVGIVDSPLYINFERGSTKLGNGLILGFIYVDKSAFNIPAYTEIYLTTTADGQIYTEKFDDAVEKIEKKVSASLDDINKEKRQLIVDREVAKAVAQKKAAIEEKLREMAKQGYPVFKIADNVSLDKTTLNKIEKEIPKATGTVINRYSNLGYASLESDSDIIDGIAKVFPLFFFLVAALVCMTTMARMVDEQRGQIGVLKALGYSTYSCIRKYLIYSGSAALIGSISGFFIGSYLFPKVIWSAYSIMYSFIDTVDFIFVWQLFLGALLVALAGAIGSTLLASFGDFKEVPAQLIRPKAPKEGKRIFLEYIGPLWKRLSFLRKVSMRNIFRYKKRLSMMVLGISGCTALILTGFGINDSIRDIADYQYKEIMHYDYSLMLKEDANSEIQDEIRHYMGHFAKDMSFIHQSNVTYETKNKPYRLSLVSPYDEDTFQKFVSLSSGSSNIPFPEKGQVVICRKFSSLHDIKVGDEIKLKLDSMETLNLKVSAITDNYVNDFAYINSNTIKSQIGKAPDYNIALVKAEKSTKSEINKSVVRATNSPYVLSSTVNGDMITRINKMMNSLNSIILLIIISAGLLAFIVIYNLTNINITERIREIATIRVLGFNIYETNLYVFRENILLTLMGSLVGLGLGRLLHAFVISEIKVDLIYFDTRILPLSYVYSVALTFLFAGLVNLFTYRKLLRIKLAEALKTVE